MNYTKQETRFLERLGITPGPWTVYKDKALFNNNDPEFIIGQCTTKKDTYFISQSPDMFLEIFRDCIQMYNLLGKESYACLVETKTTILEKAIGKTYDQLLKLWEECKE